VVDCRNPATLYCDSLQQREAVLARNSRAHPLANWQQQTLRNVEDFDAVAVTLRIERRRVIFEQRPDRARPPSGRWWTRPDS
jgi:hypothetical protein